MRGRNCRIGWAGVVGRNGGRASAQSSGLKYETISVAAFAQIFFAGEHFHPRDPRFTILGIFAPPAGVSAAERLCRPHIFQTEAFSDEEQSRRFFRGECVFVRRDCCHFARVSVNAAGHMSDSPLDFDLKFLPAWLKETPAPNRYADFAGEEPRRERDDRRGPGRGASGRGPRPPGGDRDRGPRRDDRGGARPPGPGGRGGKPGGFGGPRGQRDDRGSRDFRDQRPPEPQAPRVPVVKVEIFPEPAAATGIAKQIKLSGRACGVFRVANMFMDRFDRFRVRVTALDPAAVIYQIGDGALSFERSAVESGAFKANFDQHYVTEIVQGEPPKGNFTSVARDRLSGALLGPSSHHGYQVALRKLYEERYARRMSFLDFMRNIDNVIDPAAVEQWKQQASSATTYRTKVAEGEEPIIFKSEMEAEEHFRKTHLPTLVKSGNSLDVGGAIAGSLLDKSIGLTVRDAVEREREVPVQTVNALRPYFNEAGLQLFKWKRKILYASAIRPQRHPEGQTFSDGISAILTAVGEHPGMKRPQLAARLLGNLAADATEEAQQEHTAKLSALAADLHYLVQLGHVVEFQNGCLELPPARNKEGAHAEHGDDHRHDIAAERAGMHEAPAAESRPKEQRPPQQTREPKSPKPRRDSRYALLPLLTSASVASLG
jgi:hypothetical protein